jgi:hypothetical protein
LRIGALPGVELALEGQVDEALENLKKGAGKLKAGLHDPPRTPVESAVMSPRFGDSLLPALPSWKP